MTHPPSGPSPDSPPPGPRPRDLGDPRPPTTPDPPGGPGPSKPRIEVDLFGYLGPTYRFHDHCYSAGNPTPAPIPPPDPANPPPNPVGPRVVAR